MSIAYYERLVQEDLNVGTSITSKRNPGGGTLAATQVGLHTFGVGQAATTATWAPGVVANGSQVSTTVTVPGAAVGDFVLVSHDKILTSALILSAHVSASDTVTVVIANLSGAVPTVASGALKVLVLKSI
jgi:hypothetical protein